jgi:hypothetical protein
MIVLLLGVCELFLAPFVGGEIWALGQAALVTGLIVGWRMDDTTIRCQSLNLGQVTVDSLSRNSMPHRRAA